ncbi:MAG: glycosyltransferase family 1 protein [Chthoniobacterales bacterium]
MKLGIIDLAMGGWSAGHSYSWGLAASIQRADADSVFLTANKNISSLKTALLPEIAYLPGEWSLRSLLKLGRRNPLSASVKDLRLGAIGPILQPEQFCAGTRNIAWVPDFQPFVLEELYAEEERRKIAHRTALLLDKADSVILSSNDSLDCMKVFFPNALSKTHVLSFPSNFAFQEPAEEIEAVRERYHLPEKFLLVANQFWKHKNHRSVVEALGILKRRGKSITCVMTGLPADFRDRNNTLLSELFQYIAHENVNNECRVLGLVSRAELLGFLRTATALVQPSIFEGWNTTVQDAKALGCPLLLSDIHVHREQSPEAAAFFDIENPESLADTIGALFDVLPARPDAESERAALATEKLFSIEHGKKAIAIFEGTASSVISNAISTHYSRV